MNYQLLSDLTLALMIRAINSELNVISKHYHQEMRNHESHRKIALTDDSIFLSSARTWEEQYNALNPVYTELEAESARRQYIVDFPPNPITDRSFA